MLSKLIELSPGWVATNLNKIGRKGQLRSDQVILFPTDCGNKGIELAQQRLLISSAFGPYFAGLLERDHSYVDLESQIDSPSLVGQRGLAPLQRIYWALQYPRSHPIVMIAAEAGMGKSTLAARIVRCLYQ